MKRGSVPFYRCKNRSKNQSVPINGRKISPPSIIHILSSKISPYKNTESGIITVSYDFNATYTRASKRLVTDVILFCQAPLVLGVL